MRGRETGGKKLKGKRTNVEPLTRVNRMINTRTSRAGAKKRYDQSSADAVLDMIDQRISNLLVRSTEIESKLDALEGKPGRRSVDLSQYASASRTDSFQPRPPLKSTSELSPSKSQSTTRVESSFASKEAEIDIAELVAAVKDLTKEVAQMKEEQRKMSDQINEMHTYLIEHEEQVPAPSDDDE